jgi:hypothetical protein
MSAVRPSGPRDPWATDAGESDHFGVFAFFAVLVLFGAVGFGLYAKGSWDALNPDNLLWKDRTAVKLQVDAGSTGRPPVPLNLKPGVAPNTVAAPAPANAEPAAQPTAAPTVYVPPVAEAMGIAGPQARPTATPRPLPTPTLAQPPAGTQYKVANTNGDGAYIRRTPRLADKIVPWPDNTPMEYLGEQADGDGLHWAKVRDPRGNVGWVPTRYLGPM